MPRLLTGLITVAAVLSSLGCGGGGSASSGENSSPSQTAAQSPAVPEPVVTKVYREDLLSSEDDPDAPDYRYWDYTFDFGDRKYLARVYTDEPESAYVDLLSADGLPSEEPGALKPPDTVERANLRAILRHLIKDGWPRFVIQTLDEEGYKPLPLH